MGHSRRRVLRAAGVSLGVGTLGGTVSAGDCSGSTAALARILASEAGHAIATGAERRAVAATVLNRMDERDTDSVRAVWDAYAHGRDPYPEDCELAAAMLSGRLADPTEGATHFYSPRSMPAEGDPVGGYNVDGGLERVPGLDRRYYRPGWATEFRRVFVEGVRPAFFKFYLGEGPPREVGDGEADCAGTLCAGSTVRTTRAADVYDKPRSFARRVGGADADAVATALSVPAGADGRQYLKLRYLHTGLVGWTPLDQLSLPRDGPTGAPGGRLFGDGDAATHRHEVDADRLAVELSGPESADFDLYVTRDGRRPTRRDYDRSSTGFGPDERVVLDTADATTVGVRVRSAGGSGRYELSFDPLAADTGDDSGDAGDPPERSPEPWWDWLSLSWW
jgi:hypothetical protein